MPSNSREYSNEWRKKNLAQINITGTQEEITIIKTYVNARGEKLNSFIKSLIHAEMQRRPIDQYSAEEVQQEQEAGTGQGQEQGTLVTSQLHQMDTQNRSDCNQQEQTAGNSQQIKNDIINAIITALEGLKE